ncbi:hypothetical protein D3C78_1901070 [compost metagenome]
MGVGVHLDLQLHDVAALGGADDAGADVVLALGEGADVPGLLVVVDELVAVSHRIHLLVREGVARGEET